MVKKSILCIVLFMLFIVDTMSQDCFYLETSSILADVFIKKDNGDLIIKTLLKNKMDKNIYLADFEQSNHAFWGNDSSIFIAIGWDQFGISDEEINLITIKPGEVFESSMRIKAKNDVKYFILETNYIPYSNTNRKIRRDSRVTIYDYLLLMDCNRFMRYNKL